MPLMSSLHSHNDDSTRNRRHHKQRSAPLWRRFAALGYDSLILIALSLVYGSLITAISVGLETTGLTDSNSKELPPIGTMNKALESTAPHVIPEVAPDYDMSSAIGATSTDTTSINISSDKGVTPNQAVYTGEKYAPPHYQSIFQTGSLGELVLIGWIVCFAAFYIFFWHTSGQTLGMKAWRIQLVTDNPETKKPSIMQCAQRSAWGIMSLALAGMGYWYRFFSPTGQCLHDKLTRTHVILLAEKK